MVGSKNDGKDSMGQIFRQPIRPYGHFLRQQAKASELAEPRVRPMEEIRRGIFFQKAGSGVGRSSLFFFPGKLALPAF